MFETNRTPAGKAIRAASARVSRTPVKNTPRQRTKSTKQVPPNANTPIANTNGGEEEKTKKEAGRSKKKPAGPGKMIMSTPTMGKKGNHIAA